ncbi:MAG: winged helix-turn-helix domain-containing protein [Bacteroidaceae bacterium]|jgi:hypothetical protein|nr:winged helix-turn-helix domain-containing protein [Bacteroidaceae bacterium]
MLQAKAGNIAGIIWKSLSEAGAPQTFKQIKKSTKLSEKDFLLGVGWLLREDKLITNETGDDKDPYSYAIK